MLLSADQGFVSIWSAAPFRSADAFHISKRHATFERGGRIGCESSFSLISVSAPTPDRTGPQSSLLEPVQQIWITQSG
jgi:hypothetical protein